MNEQASAATAPRNIWPCGLLMVLMAFGRSLERYQGQIADFVSFATEAPPFPFSDWPASDS